jgi:hypothetical protein
VTSITLVRSSRPRRPLRGRRGLALLLALIVIVLAPILARAQGTGSDSVRLAWTAPGDDGTVGTASAYDLRVSDSPIDAGNWALATPVTGLPAPSAAGTRETFTVTGLTSGTVYYFALRTSDDAGNWSGISNVLRWDWVVDTAPPAAPGGISAAREGGSVRVRWASNSEPDLAGYTVWRALAAGGPYSALNGTLLTTNQFLDSSIPAGADALWYQITASDETGNVSARSASATVSLVAAVTSFALEPGYPNPSHASDAVTVPVVIPVSGAAGAVLEITDDGGRRVRRLDLSSLSPGRRTVSWDGRNEAGRQVAPGVYRAWLIAGSLRQAVRLVRVP